MAAGTTPIYTQTPALAFTNLTAASTLKDGTGATVIFTAGANGARVQRVHFQAGGTNVASVGRAFVNNGGAIGTAGNNVFIGEVALPATTTSDVAVVTNGTQDLLLDVAIPAAYRIACNLGTAVATFWAICVVANNY